MTAPHSTPDPPPRSQGDGAGTLRNLAEQWDTRARRAEELAATFQAAGLTHTETFMRGQAVGAAACAHNLRAALTDLETPCDPE